ncbi:putative short-chain dehydrogenase [Hypoxylon crocopeplum]|nr:putative short-chain dehydrogenase [Hypoxylon crocopeplum]
MNRSVYRSFTTQVLPLPYPKEDFTGKTVLITGANTGIGLEAARHFVRLNASKVILGCRDVEKGNVAKRDIEATNHVDATKDPGRVEMWQVDLASFDSVKTFCRRAAELDRLDIVVENAGVLGMTHHVAEGYERITTVNVISTWLMALLLLPVLRATKEEFYAGSPDESQGNNVPHLVIVGSNAHFYTVFDGRDEPNIMEHYRGDSDMFHRYANAKLISLFFAREVAARMLEKKKHGKSEVVLNIVEPGSCKTQLLREKETWPWAYKAFVTVGFGLVGRTAEMGSRTYISAATAGWKSHGLYLEDCKLSTPHEFVESAEGAKLQKKIYGELVEILEKISPGVTENI